MLLLLKAKQEDNEKKEEEEEVEEVDWFESPFLQTEESVAAAKADRLREKLVEFHALFEKALLSSSAAATGATGATGGGAEDADEGADDSGFGESEGALVAAMVSPGKAMPVPRLLPVPDDGPDSASLWWYKHRSQHRAMQLHGLYCFLIFSCLSNC